MQITILNADEKLLNLLNELNNFSSKKYEIYKDSNDLSDETIKELRQSKKNTEQAIKNNTLKTYDNAKEMFLKEGIL